MESWKKKARLVICDDSNNDCPHEIASVQYDLKKVPAKSVNSDQLIDKCKKFVYTGLQN